jgi:hypothetical protein
MSGFKTRGGFLGLSETREKALVEARQFFQYAAVHVLFTSWRKKCIADFNFYDGIEQYPPEFLRKLKSMGMDPLVINKVKALINQASGIEIQSRYRTAFRTHSMDENDERLAKALTHYFLYVQEHNNMPVYGSQKFRDMLICGVGWSNLYLQDNRIGYDYVHPLNILYDADDFSPFMTDQRYVIRIHWVAQEKAKMLWPKYAKDIEDLFAYAEPANVGSFSNEFFSRISEYIDLYAIGGGGVGGRILVPEVQRKIRKKYYQGIDQSGREFQTFSEKEAYELTGDHESTITQHEGHQVIRTVFCRDIVFEHGPLHPNLPNGEFTYVPSVYSRRSSDAVPEGWLDTMKDIQRIVNYTKLKQILMENSTRVIADAEAIPAGYTYEDYKEMVSDPAALIVKNKEAEVTLHPNVDLADSQIQAARRLDEELQQVTGMFSDALGAPTNATAGVAINSRAKLSITNQRVGFDHFELMKKREGQIFLDIIQGSGAENMMAPILDDDEKDIVIMNLSREVDGKKVVFNDIRTLPLSIYVEQTHDYESSPEEQRTTFETLLANPNAQMIMQSPGILKLLGIRNWEKISQEMDAAAQKKMQMEQMAAGNGPGQPGGLPQQMGAEGGNLPNPLMMGPGGQ